MPKRYTLFLVILSAPFFGVAQSKDSLPGKTFPQDQQAHPLAEIFTSGFLDIMNSGQVNAAARFIRLYIGEPGKFILPVSFYSCVSTNGFQSDAGIQGLNETLFANFINPLGGLANASSDGILFFNHSKKQTKMGMLYHGGERILTGTRPGPATDPLATRPVNFLNSFGCLGLYFQTGAWEKSDTARRGISWFAARYIACYTSAKLLGQIIPSINTSGLYFGYSLAWGVEISNLVNIKAVYYKYIKPPELDYFLPIYQFSFNYSLKK